MRKLSRKHSFLTELCASNQDAEEEEGNPWVERVASINNPVAAVTVAVFSNSFVVMCDLGGSASLWEPQLRSRFAVINAGTVFPTPLSFPAEEFSPAVAEAQHTALMDRFMEKQERRRSSVALPPPASSDVQTAGAWGKQRETPSQKAARARERQRKGALMMTRATWTATSAIKL